MGCRTAWTAQDAVGEAVQEGPAVVQLFNAVASLIYHYIRRLCGTIRREKLDKGVRIDDLVSLLRRLENDPRVRPPPSPKGLKNTITPDSARYFQGFGRSCQVPL